MTYHFLCVFFFFNDTATTEIYTLSLHDALPISVGAVSGVVLRLGRRTDGVPHPVVEGPDAREEADRCADSCTDRLDRKSTRLNSSHSQISYAVFCLKKKTEALFDMIDECWINRR